MKRLIFFAFAVILVAGTTQIKSDSRVLADAWHIPSSTIPAGPTMRDPVFPTTVGPVTFYVGINPEDVATSVILWSRPEPSGPYASLEMQLFQQVGGDEYWSVIFNLVGTMYLEYYFEVNATSYETTYIYGTDTTSATTATVSVAQAGAFRFSIPTPTPTPMPETPTAQPSTTSTPTLTPSIPPPTSTPPATITPEPTLTPTPPVTITPEPTLTPTPGAPTATQLPSSPTPTPSPTATPPQFPYVLDLILNSTFFYPNDPFLLTVQIWNYSTDVISVNLFTILDYYGSYFFAPDWTHEIAYQQTVIQPTGSTPLTYVLLDFPWPNEDLPSASGIRFYSGMTDPEMSYLIGNFDVVEFGW